MLDTGRDHMPSKIGSKDSMYGRGDGFRARTGEHHLIGVAAQQDRDARSCLLEGVTSGLPHLVAAGRIAEQRHPPHYFADHLVIDRRVAA